MLETCENTCHELKCQLIDYKAKPWLPSCSISWLHFNPKLQAQSNDADIGKDAKIYHVGRMLFV
jgi:hypothetical protein